MKVPIYSFAFLALLAVAYALEDCPKIDGQYAVSVANPADCTTFYACSSGRPYLLHCPEGLVYNAKLGICDWAEDVKCTVTEDDNSVTVTESRILSTNQ